jgi:tRNA nucleotidyltransferase (CCA-adding enzyme)
MQLPDIQLTYYVDQVLKLPPGKRQEYLNQMDYLIEQLEAKINDDSIFTVKKFTKCGSMMKGTVLKPRDGDAADADVAVELDVSEADAQDIDHLHSIILSLLINVYPQKVPEDFTIQPRTLGVVFRVSGLNLDLVPIVPVPGRPGYGWQYSSQGDAPVVTSVRGQLDFVAARAKADPSFRPLVRMLKRWRNYKELDFLGSFTIELLVAFLQDRNGPAPTLEEGVLRFFLYIAQSQLKEVISFPESGLPKRAPDDPVAIIDPVNVENNVARRIHDYERAAIVAAAQTTWETLCTASYADAKGQTIDYWKEQFGTSFRIED